MRQAANKVGFRIEGRPMAWKRARLSGKRFFKDANSAAYQYKVSSIAKIAAGDIFFTGPVHVEIVFSFKWPKKRPLSDWFPSRPDGDNLAKQILDALNKVIWHDDAQVVKLSVEKRYGDEEFSWVEITEL